MKRKYQKKISRLLLGSWLAFTLSGCASVPDQPICTDLTPKSGFCVWTISGKEQVVDDVNLLNGQTWYDLSMTTIKMPVESFVELKKYIINQCKRNKNCTDKIDNWERLEGVK